MTLDPKTGQPSYLIYPPTDNQSGGKENLDADVGDPMLPARPRSSLATLADGSQLRATLGAALDKDSLLDQILVRLL